MGLSGVLAFREIDPWNFVSRSGLLILNPWAAKSLPATGFGVDELKVAGDVYERERQPLSSLLELPDAWPEEGQEGPSRCSSVRDGLTTHFPFSNEASKLLMPKFDLPNSPVLFLRGPAAAQPLGFPTIGPSILSDDAIALM